MNNDEKVFAFQSFPVLAIALMGKHFIIVVLLHRIIGFNPPLHSLQKALSKLLKKEKMYFSENSLNMLLI